MARPKKNKEENNIENKKVEGSVVLKVGKVVNNEEEMLEQATDINSIEVELNEEYKEEIKEAEEAKAKVESEADLTLEEEVELIDKYSDCSKAIEGLSQLDTEEMMEKVGEELQKADELKKQVEKKIETLENELSEKQKEIANNVNKSAYFSNFWNGVNYNF